MTSIALTGRCPLLNTAQLPKTWNPDVIDLSELVWITPFEVASIAALWSRLVATGCDPSVRLPRNPMVRSYLVDIGLNEIIQGRWGNGGGSAVEPPWLPLTRLESGNDWDDLLQDLWPDVAGLFANPDLTRNTMELLGELIDNAVTHGHSNTGTYVCAQRYTGTTSNLPQGIWIGVADSGVGIPRHLRRNPKYSDIEDDRQLIRLARQPWVTGTTERRGWGLVEVFDSATEAGPARIVIRSGGAQGEFRLQSGIRVSARYRSLRPSVPGTWIHVRLEPA